MGKRIIQVITCVLMIVAMAIPAQATQQLRLSYISYASADVSVSNGKAAVQVNVDGYPNTTKITIAAALQQYRNGVWATVITYATVTGTTSASLNKATAVNAGTTYRVKATITAYSGSAKETETFYSGEVEA